MCVIHCVNGPGVTTAITPPPTPPPHLNFYSLKFSTVRPVLRNLQKEKGQKVTYDRWSSNTGCLFSKVKVHIYSNRQIIVLF